MPVLLLLLLVGVLMFLWWKRRTTTLTRECRWRQDRRDLIWRCAFCGAVSPGTAQPLDCRRGGGNG